MRRSGLVCVADSQEKIAADRKRQRDLAMGQMLGDLGPALWTTSCGSAPGASASAHDVLVTPPIR